MSNRADQNTGIEAPGTSGHAFNTALDALELANNPFDIIEISRTFQGFAESVTKKPDHELIGLWIFWLPRTDSNHRQGG